MSESLYNHSNDFQYAQKVNPESQEKFREYLALEEEIEIYDEDSATPEE